jgi:hypothetical protein
MKERKLSKSMARNENSSKSIAILSCRQLISMKWLKNGEEENSKMKENNDMWQHRRMKSVMAASKENRSSGENRSENESWRKRRRKYRLANVALSWRRKPEERNISEN